MKLKAYSLAIMVVLLLVGRSSELAAQQGKPAQAQTAEAVRELIVVAQNITANNEKAAGKARRDDAALPGDVVEYRLVFTNTKDFALKNVVFQDPIPAGLSYLASTAKSSREDVTVEYSIDGGKTWSAKPMVQVVENGKKVTKPAQPETYTNVRWRVTGMVSPGASVEAQFRTRVNAVPSPTTK